MTLYFINIVCESSIHIIVGDESWKEMVQEAVKDDEELQRELVVQVAVYGDLAEALKWAHHYEVKRDYWPYNLKMLSDNPDCDR